MLEHRKTVRGKENNNTEPNTNPTEIKIKIKKNSNNLPLSFLGQLGPGPMFDPKICDLKDGMIMIIRQIYGSPMRLFQICINKLKLIKNFDCKNKRVSIFNQGLGMI